MIILPERKGKPNAINLARSFSKYDILVFSDTRQVLHAWSINRLVDNFKDANVGLVSSKLNQKCSSCVMRKWLNAIKRLQSSSGNLIGAYGALFAIRKSLLPEVPRNMVLDDLFISLSVLDSKHKIVMSEKAIVEDVNFEHFYSNHRSVRIGGGLIQFVWSKAFRKEFSFATKMKLFMGKFFRLTLGPLSFIYLCFQLPISISIGIGCFLLLVKSCRYTLRILIKMAFSFSKINRNPSVLWHQLKTDV